MTGDVGSGGWQAAAKVTMISHNRFGKDAPIMTGNAGPDAAIAFVPAVLELIEYIDSRMLALCKTEMLRGCLSAVQRRMNWQNKRRKRNY